MDGQVAGDVLAEVDELAGLGVLRARVHLLRGHSDASDQRSPKSKTAQRVIDGAAAGPELVYLAWPTVMAYLRIATHPGVFETPLTPAEALRSVGALLELPFA